MNYSRKTKTDERVSHPATLREARNLIAECFKFNRWDTRDEKVFYALLSLEYQPPDELNIETARAVLAEMESAKMILFD